MLTVKQKLDLAITALEFYANKSNYADTHKSAKENLRIITLKDCDKKQLVNIAGKTARETLAKIKG